MTSVGIVGAGAVVAGAHLPVLSNIPDVRVAWVCDRDLPRAQALAGSYKVSTAFASIVECPDVDVALVATPVGSRPEVIPQVLSRGWHAFCEKPFALTRADHDAFVAAAVRRGLQIGVGQVRRYAGPTASARSLVERGILGPIVRVMAADGVRMRGTGRGGGWHLADRASGGGVLAETGSHLIDQLIHVVGGVGASLRECSQQVHLGLELASSLVADVTTGTGRTVECRIEVSLLEDLCNGVFVEYPTCMLRVGLAFDDTLTLVSKRNQTVAELVVRGGATSAVQAFYLEWMDFLSQCRTGIPSTVDAATVRTTTALIEDAIRAGSREPAEELSLVARAR